MLGNQMTTHTKQQDFAAAEALTKALNLQHNEDVMSAEEFFFLQTDEDLSAKVDWMPFSETGLDFKLAMTEAVWRIPGTRLTRFVPKKRGVPDAYIINPETMDVLDAVSSDWYRIIDNEQCHNATLAGLEAALPPSFLVGHEMKGFAGRSGAFSQCMIDIPGYSFEIANGTGKTNLGLNVSWKNDLKLSTQVCIGARDLDSGNLINLGVSSSIAQRHKGAWNAQAIIDHIGEWVNGKFAERIDCLQQMMKTSVTHEQVELALMMGKGRMLSENEAVKICDHIFDEEVQYYGKSKFAVMSGLASFCTDDDAFPVRNSEAEDNVAETLAIRQSQVAKLVMTHFFYGRSAA
jgi:hypothetical protein